MGAEKGLLKALPKDTPDGKAALTSIISMRAQGGDENAMRAMDYIQEISTENWDDLSPELKQLIAKVFKSLQSIGQQKMKEMG